MSRVVQWTALVLTALNAFWLARTPSELRNNAELAISLIVCAAIVVFVVRSVVGAR